MKMMLTQRALETLKVPVGKSNVTVWDLGALGLGLRKGARSASWVLRVQKGGKRMTQTIGQWPALSLKDARALATTAREGLLEGSLSADDRLPVGEGDAGFSALQRPKTADDGFELYWQRHVEPNLARAKSVKAHWRRDISPIIGQRALITLRRADVLNAVDRLYATKSLAVATSGARLLRACMNWLSDREYVSAGIAARIKIRTVAPRERLLSVAEVQQALDAADDMGLRAEGVVRLLWLTAARANEIAGLRWDEIDLQARQINLSADRTKTREARIIYLSDAAVALIERMRPFSSDELLFPALRPNRAGQHYTPANLPAQIRKATGMTDFKLHDIRRACASHLATAGCSMEVIKICLGHVSAQVFPGATGAYVKKSAYEQRCREAMEKLALLVD